MGEGIPLSRVILLLAFPGVKGRGLIFPRFPRREAPLAKLFFPLLRPPSAPSGPAHLRAPSRVLFSPAGLAFPLVVADNKLSAKLTLAFSPHPPLYYRQNHPEGGRTPLPLIHEEADSMASFTSAGSRMTLRVQVGVKANGSPDLRSMTLRGVDAAASADAVHATALALGALLDPPVTEVRKTDDDLVAA